MADDKDQQFTRMWNEENKSKRAKFRNLMKAKLDVLHVEVTEENARAFWNGRLAVRQPERIYQMPARPEGRMPPRRRWSPAVGFVIIANLEIRQRFLRP